MTPTPFPSGPTFQHLRNWARRGHESPRSTQTPVAHQIPVTPLVDHGLEGNEQGEGEGEGEGEAVWTEDEEEEEEEEIDDDEGVQEEAVDGVGERDDAEGVEDHDGEEDGIEDAPMDIDPHFNPSILGLKEISNLASWTVSSHKPGCGVDALRDDDTSLFWQSLSHRSDGPQPHHLNIHFSRLVPILAIRLFLDFEADESYTPTRITLLAGTGYHDLIPFSALEFAQPKGWVDVPLDHVGGGKDGRTLRAFLVQVRVDENHQNGKDTHMRGLKIFARDERAGGRIVAAAGKGDRIGGARQARDKSWAEMVDWMDEPMLR